MERETSTALLPPFQRNQCHRLDHMEVPRYKLLDFVKSEVLGKVKKKKVGLAFDGSFFYSCMQFLVFRSSSSPQYDLSLFVLPYF